MISDLTKMKEDEVESLNLMCTHFNIQYNRSTRYKKIHTSLSTVHPTAKNELWCIITNTARAIKYGAKGLKIPRIFSAYKDNVQKLSHDRMCVLLDKMEKQGYLDYYRGGLVKMDKELRITSIYTFTDKYLQLWKGIDVSQEKNDYTFLKIRDRLEKYELSTRRRAGVAEMQEVLLKYNALLEQTNISVNGTALPTQQYARIFTDNLEHGGRYYNLAGGVQTMPSRFRPTITINGDRVVEVDFKALHPNLLYEQVERELGMAVGITDPYAVDLDGLFELDSEAISHMLGHNPKRNLVKQVMLKAFNARDIHAAASTVTQEWYAEHRRGDKGKYYGLSVISHGGKFPAKALCERVADAHPLIRGAFFSDVGLVLQKVDSEIITLVIKNFLTIDVPVLSWHDSVVVQAKYKELLCAQMLKAYKDVVGSDSRCNIEVKGE